MNRVYLTRVTLLALFVLGGQALCFAEVPFVQVGRGAAPAADGDLSDEAWASCAQVFPFIRGGGEQLASVQTKAMVFYDGAALHVAFVCDEPDMGALIAENTGRDTSLWHDDCVELYLKRPNQDGYYQLIVNTLGNTFDARNGERAWDPKLAVGVGKGEQEWSVELSIPWAELGGAPGPGEIWTANFCRERKVKSELSSWSAVVESFGVAETFGELHFADAPARLEVFEVAPPLPGANIASVQLILPGGASGELRVKGCDPVALGPACAEPLTVAYPLGLDDEGVRFEALAVDTLVWRGVLPAVVSPSPQLSNLKRAIQAFRAARGNLPAGGPLAGSVDEALDRAAGAEQALESAIKESLDAAKPMDPGKYQQLNAEAASEVRRLDAAGWVLWSKSNWSGLERTELPGSVESIGHKHVTSLVNEYESDNFIISNLSSEPLRLRITASDLQSQPPLDRSANLLRNSGFEEGAANPPQYWGEGSGDPKNWRAETVPGRGRAIAIDCAGILDKLTIRQTVELEKGQTYTLEFWSKASESAGSVQVGVINSGWTWASLAPPITGSHDWLPTRRAITPRATGPHQLVIFPKGGGSGQVWIDDVALVKGGTGPEVRGATAPRLSVADWQELRVGSVVADPLIPLNPAGRLDVPAGESRQVWLTFPARDLPPGRYECTVAAKPLATLDYAGSPPSKRLRIEYNVKPVRLDTHPDFAVYNWDYAREESYVRDLAAHKVNFMLAPTSMPLPQFDENGTPQSEMDFTSLDAVLRLKLPYTRAAGGQLLFAYGIIRDFETSVSKRYGWEFMDAAWVKAFRYAYGEWLKRLKSHGLGYEEFCVQIWDEATGEGALKSIEGAKLLREIDPNVRLVMDGAQSIKEVTALDPYIDVWVPHLHNLLHPNTGAALLAHYKGLGEPVYTYTCSVNMKSQSAYTYHRLKPWYAAQLGLDGVFYWDYNSWRNDPWDDFDGPMADCGAVYDSATGPITSRRWEASREGIEDWQLMRLIERFGDAEASAAVQKALDAVLTNKDRHETVDECRMQLIDTAVKLAQADPLEIADIAAGAMEGAINFSFKTNRPARGTLLYRLPREVEWRAHEVPEATTHRIHVPLPFFAEADWTLLMWDASGRVATAEKPE